MKSFKQHLFETKKISDEDMRVWDDLSRHYSEKGHKLLSVYGRGPHYIVQTQHPEGKFYHVTTVNNNGIHHRITKRSMIDAKNYRDKL